MDMWCMVDMGIPCMGMPACDVIGIPGMEGIPGGALDMAIMPAEEAMLISAETGIPMEVGNMPVDDTGMPSDIGSMGAMEETGIGADTIGISAEEAITHTGGVFGSMVGVVDNGGC
jgi:hypothetical protein